MSITIKQLETLANHFHFDMTEARQVIGIELKQRGRPRSPSEVEGHHKPKTDKKPKEEKPKEEKPKTEKKPKEEKPKEEKPKAEKKPRGPSGYNLFVRDGGISFKNAGAAWKALSESERENWNAKAKAN
jgi:outer membrane biosynthesis protein TonB